ncbi:hypothetical protein ACEPPN_013207 [Leptodophora sp. 'Broadleaf-Isolate-01']
MSYYICIPLEYADSISKTTSILAFEAYTNRNELDQTHLTSAAMSKCFSEMGTIMSTSVDVSYNSAIAGFLDLPGDRRECGIMQDTRIICSSPSARASVLFKLKALATVIEAAEKMESCGVFTYMVFESLDDETGVRIFGRFADRESMETFLRRKEVVGFWLGSKEEVKSMECRGYVPNGKGWLHR